MKWYGTTYQPEWNNDSVAFFEADIETILSEKGFTWIPLTKKIEYKLPYDWLVANAPVNWEIKYLKCDLEIEGQPPLYFFRKDMNTIQAISKDNKLYVEWVFEMDYYYTYFRDMFNVLLAANPEVQMQRCFTNRWSHWNPFTNEMSLNFNDSWWFKNQLPINIPLNKINNFNFDINKIYENTKIDGKCQVFNLSTQLQYITIDNNNIGFSFDSNEININVKTEDFSEYDEYNPTVAHDFAKYNSTFINSGKGNYLLKANYKDRNYYIKVYTDTDWEDTYLGGYVDQTMSYRNPIQIKFWVNDTRAATFLTYGGSHKNKNTGYEQLYSEHEERRYYELYNETWTWNDSFITKLTFSNGAFRFITLDGTLLKWELVEKSNDFSQGFGISANRVIGEGTISYYFIDTLPDNNNQWSYAIINGDAIKPKNTNPFYDDWIKFKSLYNQSYFIIPVFHSDYIYEDLNSGFRDTILLEYWKELFYDIGETNEPDFAWNNLTVFQVFKCGLPPSIVLGSNATMMMLYAPSGIAIYFPLAPIDSKISVNSFNLLNIEYDFKDMKVWDIDSEPYFLTEQFKQGYIFQSNNAILNIPYTKFNYDYNKDNIPLNFRLTTSDGLYLFLDTNDFIAETEKNINNDSYSIKISNSDAMITTSYSNWLANNSQTELTSRQNLADEYTIMNRDIQTINAKKISGDVDRWSAFLGSTIRNFYAPNLMPGLVASGGMFGGVTGGALGLLSTGINQYAAQVENTNAISNMKTSFGIKERTLESQFQNIKEAPASINVNNNNQCMLKSLNTGFLLTEKTLSDEYKQAVMNELMDYGYVFGGVVPIKKYNNRVLYNIIQVNIGYNFDKLLEIIKQNYFGIWNYQLAILKFLDWLSAIHRLYKTNTFDVDKTQNIEISLVVGAEDYIYELTPLYYYNSNNIVNWTLKQTDIYTLEVKIFTGTTELNNNVDVFNYETANIPVSWMYYDKYDIYYIDNPQHTGIIGVYNATRDQAGTIIGPVSGAVWLEPYGHVSSVNVSFEDGKTFTYNVDWTYYQDTWISNSSLEGSKITLTQNNYQLYQCHSQPNWNVEDINSTNNILKTWTGSTLDGSDWLFAYQHLNDINMIICDDNNINIANGLNTLGHNYCDSMFRGCSNLTSFGSNFLQPQNVKSVGNSCCDHMFENCINLSSLPEAFIFFQGLSSAGDYFAADMFADCSSLTHLPSGFNVAINITEIKPHFLQNMFADCINLSTLSPYFSFPSALSSPIVGDSVFADTFVNCKSLSSLPQNLSIPQAITQVGRDFCISLFDGCSNLTSLPSNFNLPQNISTIDIGCFAYMFKNCSNLSSLPSNFNLPQNIVIPQPLPDGNVNPAGNYFLYDAFSSCSSLGLANHSSEESPYYFTIPSVFPDNFYFGTWFVDGQNEDVWVSSFPEKSLT